MTVEPSRSQYRQVADLIRADIDSGQYPAGSTLPSEDELAERYGVSRRTVNRAESILRTDGLIRVERGRGTVVRELPVIRRQAAYRFAARDVAGARGAYQAELERLGLTSRVDLEITEIPVPADLREAFGSFLPQRTISRARKMYAHEVPIQLATSWIPLQIAGGTVLAQADTGPGGTYSRLADLGWPVAHFTEAIRLRQAEPDEAAFLRLDAEQRVYIIRRTARTANDQVVEVTDSVIAAHQWELVYDWEAGL